MRETKKYYILRDDSGLNIFLSFIFASSCFWYSMFVLPLSLCILKILNGVYDSVVLLIFQTVMTKYHMIGTSEQMIQRSCNFLD